MEGTRDICSCCETGNCESPAQSRRLSPLERWPGRRFRRHDAKGEVPVGTEGTPRAVGQTRLIAASSPGKEAEADVVIGPVLLSRVPDAVREQQEGGHGESLLAPAPWHGPGDET